MTSLGRSHPHRRGWRLVVLAAALLAVCAIALWRPWVPAPEPATGATGADAPPAIAPAPLVVADGARVLVFGDSWTYGSAATVPTDGYAYRIGDLLGWDVIVDGVRGSGYLKAGQDGGGFGERIADLDPAIDPEVVIVQGSINDRRLYPDGYRDAVNEAWDDLAALYPDAAIVVLGPAPQVLPVERATTLIDADLAHLAAIRGWWYISPVQDDWITEANYLDVIDTGVGRNHPSNAGHAYLAEQVAAAIAALSEAPDVVADAPTESAVAP